MSTSFAELSSAFSDHTSVVYDVHMSKELMDEQSHRAWRSSYTELPHGYMLEIRITYESFQRVIESPYDTVTQELPVPTAPSHMRLCLPDNDHLQAAEHLSAAFTQLELEPPYQYCVDQIASYMDDFKTTHPPGSPIVVVAHIQADAVQHLWHTWLPHHQWQMVDSREDEDATTTATALALHSSDIETFGETETSATISRVNNSCRGIEVICAVCLDEFNDSNHSDTVVMKTSCGHYFHKECIDPWFARRSNCPMCRTAITFSAY